MVASMRSRWSETTSYLWFCAIAFAWGNVLFGVDTGSFGSTQSLPSFLKTFGVQDDQDGSYSLPTSRKAMMNSVVWPGKLLGALSFEPLLERVGYKRAIYVCIVLQMIAVTVEITATEWIQFSAGRVIAYYTVGIIENAVPSYQAEIAPQSLRGFFTGSLMCITGLGNMIGAGMGRLVAEDQSPTGWKFAVGVQYIPAIILALMVPYTIESPRWLIQHNKLDSALENLNRIRPAYMREDGTTDAEVDAIFLAFKQQDNSPGSRRSSNLTTPRGSGNNHQTKAKILDDGSGSWSDLFRGTHLPRTIIASALFFFQQTAGGQFVNSYAPTFLVMMGLGTEAFTWTFATQVVGFFAAASVLFVVDTYGRRPVLLGGLFLVALSDLAIAIFGGGSGSWVGKKPVTGVVVGAMMVLGTSMKFSAATLAFLVAAEIGGVKMRKKTMGFATAVDVCSAGIVTFTLPYLLGDPVNMGSGVGWFLGLDAVVALVFSYMFVPELKGVSLEEVDDMFEGKPTLWGNRQTGRSRLFASWTKSNRDSEAEYELLSAREREDS